MTEDDVQTRERECHWFRTLRRWLNNLIDFVFALLEIHLIKLVALSIMLFCCFNVNILHYAVVIVLVFSILMGLNTVAQSFKLIGLYLSLLLLTKMIYQTDFVPKDRPIINCTDANLPIEERLKLLLTDLKWMGYKILEREDSLMQMIGYYLLVLLAMTLQSVVYARQRMKRIDSGEPDTIPPVLFPHITRQEADYSIKRSIQYLCNYGFYKFGIELTLTLTAITAAFRMDVISVFYSFWITIFSSLHRTAISKLWPIFFTSVAFCILFQYAMVVGLPPYVCIDYPWKISQSLVVWLNLASFEKPPDGRKIVVDFVLLLAAWRQKRVFDLERKFVNDYPGGSNKEEYYKYYDINFVNPYPDHTTYNKSPIDWIKNFIITTYTWVVLAFVYWVGVRDMNVLSLGYLVGAFIFLWIGYDFCLWNIEKILRWWNVLLAYTVLVIMLKCVYEVASCAYLEYLKDNYCWLVYLLNMSCTNEPTVEHKTCISDTNNSLYWDAVCFGLLLFQKRLFCSFYFMHQVEDMKSLVLIQTKGALLIERLMQAKIIESENQKRKTLEKIKKKMKRIKDWQKKIYGHDYLEPTDHATAVHMGDYYMFDEELDAQAESISSSSDEDDKDKKEKTRKKTNQRINMAELIESILKSAGHDKAQSRSTTPRKKLGEDEKHKKVEDKEGEPSEEDPDKRSETEPKKESKLKKFIRFLARFFESACLGMILFLDKHSKDYRFIEAVMNDERISTKIMRKVDSPHQPRESSSTNLFGMKRIESRDLMSVMEQFNMKETEERFRQRKKRASALLCQLIMSFSYFAISHTEFFCYVIIFLHQTLSPTILSLPLTLFTLLWGTLTTIRPTTTFWIVLIAYLEATVLIKAVFQNSIFPWNHSYSYFKNSPTHPPLILGILPSKNYATADLFLLFMLFLHRYQLKRNGMWKSTNEEETLPPQNLGIYNELETNKDDEMGNTGLKSELMKVRLGRIESNTNLLRGQRLAKWKCTSRAMAGIYLRGGKVRTKVNVQEIEGHIIVTHEGRRLIRSEAVETVPGHEMLGEVVLRVFTSNQANASRAVYCKLSLLQHLAPFRKFFIQITDPKGRLSQDFYTIIFIFEFLTFLIIFFGFSHFTDQDNHRNQEQFYFTDNYVPPWYLVAVFLHFGVIIIDRILYLRKSVVGKLVLQIFQVLLIHIWMFLILPEVTDLSFTEVTLAMMYYFFTCLYFLMSAYQLRVGYPFRVQGHFLCKRYRYVNLIAYKCLQFIPFFNQLRTVLDYICIHTSLSIMEWLKVESIFQIIFENKCARRADQRYPSKRGIKYPRCKKYVPGTLALFFIILIMWCPFILFAIFKTVAERNLPNKAVLDLTIGTFGKVYTTATEYESIIPFTYADYGALKDIYKDNKKVWSFLSNYKFEDVAALKFRSLPLGSWEIRPGEFDRFNETIQSREIALSIYLTWTIYRTERPQIVATAHGNHEYILEKNSPMRDEFARAFNGEGNSIFMKNMLPKFIQVNNEGNANPVAGFLSQRNRTKAYRSINLRLSISNRTDGTNEMLWEINEGPKENSEITKLDKIPYHDSKNIVIYTFNQKNLPKPLLNISRRGIAGLYLSIVLFTWTVVKRLMCKYPFIMFDDMPNVDRVLQLCNDIYLARESHEFALEEDLYAKLIFLFRSPETLIKWTRVNSNNDETEDQERRVRFE